MTDEIYDDKGGTTPHDFNHVEKPPQPEFTHVFNHVGKPPQPEDTHVDKPPQGPDMPSVVVKKSCAPPKDDFLFGVAALKEIRRATGCASESQHSRRRNGTP